MNMRLAPIGFVVLVLWACSNSTADFCRNATAAQCRKLFACLPDAGQSRYATESGCEAASDCSDATCNNFDSAKASGCLAAIDALGCDALSEDQLFVSPSACFDVCADP
jgi:hypothetical protein